jgi:hypothetical protein
MANTSPRPSIGTSTGLVTYVDGGGNTYPAVVLNDYGAAVNISPTSGCVDLAYVDTNPADAVLPEDFTAKAHGRKLIYSDSVPDQGNAGVTSATNVPVVTTVATSITSTSTSATVSSAVGIAPAGSVTGTGIPASTTYTLSGTTVTLSAAATATNGTASLTFTPASPSNLVVTGSTTGIPSTGYVTGPGIPQSMIPNPVAALQPTNPDLPAMIPAGTPYTLSGSTVTLANGVIPTTGATGALLFFSAQPIGYWRYPTSYTI